MNTQQQQNFHINSHLLIASQYNEIINRLIDDVNINGSDFWPNLIWKQIDSISLCSIECEIYLDEQIPSFWFGWCNFSFWKYSAAQLYQWQCKYDHRPYPISKQINLFMMWLFFTAQIYKEKKRITFRKHEKRFPWKMLKK